jgi:hypothetical protein
MYEESYELKSQPEFGNSDNLAPSISQEWLLEPGEFLIQAKLSTDDIWTEKMFPTNNDSNMCYLITISVLRDNEISIGYDPDSDGCD